MNTPDNNNTLTFSEFLSKHYVQIPVIQRDYVQGRSLSEKETEKRDEFVVKLLNALLPDGTPCHLDFVYGGRESFGNDKVEDEEAPFLPLDGQQRLTTLFLLHWLLLQKNVPAADNMNETELFAYRMKFLSKFSYKTRISSGRFCQKLTEWQADPECSLIEQIEEKYWYDHDMQSDPTVKAMMQMLSCMEKMLDSEPYASHRQAMFGNLYDDSKRCITFDVLDMEQYNLTDGLYVKMNARGKGLTAFENWKADFIDMLASCSADDNDALRTEQERFSYSIEHEWCDVFWKIAYQDYMDKLSDVEGGFLPYPRIDDMFMNFFNNFTRLLFFIAPENQSLNAEDYKAGLWSTVSGVYKENMEFRCMLFDMLDSLHGIDVENGSIQKFFSEIFTEEVMSGKVRLFEDNVDLFGAACSSSSFSVNHILFFAILLYCTRYKKYVADWQLLNYARFCRNYLYEHNQFDSAKVTVAPQIRASEMAQYLRFFKALVLDVDPLISLQKLELKDEYALREKAKLIYYEKPKIAELVRNLEDLPITYGNLSAFTSVLEKCMNDESYCDTVWEAVEAFVQAPALTKVRLFVALGYKGIEVRNCAYGKAVFLGGEFKGTQRWMVHFRKKYDSSSPLDAWMMRYVEAFSQESDLNQIVVKHMPNDKHSVVYYMLKYPDVLASHIDRRKDYSQAPFYFAMMRPWADLDMITIHSFSGHPLNNAYQVCPMVNAVVRQIDRFEKYNQARRIGYVGQYADKAGITINEYPNGWDRSIFYMHFGRMAWLLYKETYDRLPSSLQNELQQEGDCYVLNQTEDRDLIEVAVDFVNKVIDNFEQRGLLK